MNLLSLDTNHPLLLSELKEKGFSVEEDTTSSYEEICSKIADFQGIIIRSRIPVDKNFLEKAQNLQFIARVGAGMENIDVLEAETRNIKLFNAPEGNRDSVAEHALGMLLVLLHRLKIADAEVRNGIWKRAENRGDELMGKTVGLIGYGHMGKAFAKRLSGFGVEVICYDILENMGDVFAKQVSLSELFERTDVLSLHVPLTEQTDQMIDAEFLSNFQKPMYLINTARGQCVNTADLLQALENQRIKGACLDVLEYEKASFTALFEENEVLEKLLQSEKVLFSPHIAGWSHQSNEKLSQTIVAKILKDFS